ncbi:hypothetical protein IW262DRAFT_1299323 [Armillaria fumosa]|nr:hypothetical protein IW262DRAFT_1299323 [Armillaria fumosa]
MTNIKKFFFQLTTNVINKVSGAGAYKLTHLVWWDDVLLKDDAEEFPLHISLDDSPYHQSLDSVQMLPDRVMSSLPVYGSHNQTLTLDKSKGTQSICIPLEMLYLYSALDPIQVVSDKACHSALCLKATIWLTIQHELSQKSLTWATDDIYDTAASDIQGGDGPLDSGFLTEIQLTRGRTELVQTQAGWLELGQVHLWELNPNLRKSTSTLSQLENNQVNQEDLKSDSEADPDHDNVESDSKSDPTDNHVTDALGSLLMSLAALHLDHQSYLKDTPEIAYGYARSIGMAAQLLHKLNDKSAASKILPRLFASQSKEA